MLTTLASVHAATGIPIKTLRRWCAAGLIDGAVPCAGRWRVPADTADRIRSRGVPRQKPVGSAA